MLPEPHDHVATPSPHGKRDCNPSPERTPSNRRKRGFTQNDLERVLCYRRKTRIVKPPFRAFGQLRYNIGMEKMSEQSTIRSPEQNQERNHPMAWEYSDKTMQLFMDAIHGREGTHVGEIENPDGIGEHGSIACGDSMRFTFRCEKNDDPTKDRIVEAKFLTFGCTSAIASSEALCRIIEERKCTPIEALKITNQDIVDFVDGLPAQKIHCSVMGAEALEAAVYNWSQKRGVDLEKLGVRFHETDEDEGRIVCRCFSITEPYLRRQILELNLHTLDEVTGALKAGGACQTCRYAPGGIQDILTDVWAKQKGVTGGKTELSVIHRTQPPKSTLPDGTKCELPNATATGATTETTTTKTTTKTTTTGVTASATTESMSPFQFAKQVEKILAEVISPMLACDGGLIELIDIKDKTIYCSLQGSCADCLSAKQTLKQIVERSFHELLDPEIKVIQV